MARRLASTVVVRHPESMRAVALLKGSLLPDWADGLVSPDRTETVDEVASVGDGTGVDGAPPVAEPAEDRPQAPGAQGGPHVDHVAPADVDVSLPERPHGNAGRDAWAAYAEALGLDVPGDATKADIRRLVGD